MLRIRMIEEAIATYGTREVAKVLGLPKHRKPPKSDYMKTLRVNGLEEKEPTEADWVLIEKGILEAVELAKALVAEHKEIK